MPLSSKMANLVLVLLALMASSMTRPPQAARISPAEKLIAARAPLQAGLPGEPIYGMTPLAGLPKGWQQDQ
jgi:hypothetical protein